MTDRRIFMLATAMMLLFFLLSNYDRFFFTIHFLESVIYLAILLLLYYGVEDWAYVFGFLSPLFWIVLTLLQGPSVMGLKALGRLITFQGVPNPASFLPGIILLVGLALLASCARAFYRNIWGTEGAARTLILATVVTILYYGLLMLVLLERVRPEAAAG